jgi:hypothetical protein
VVGDAQVLERAEKASCVDATNCAYVAGVGAR